MPFYILYVVCYIVGLLRLGLESGLGSVFGWLNGEKASKNLGTIKAIKQ